MSEHCPYCDVRIKDFDDYNWDSGREEVHTECGSCGKDIVVHRTVLVDYCVTMEPLSLVEDRTPEQLAEDGDT